MPRREFIAGGNFSGRSETLRAELARAEAFFLGPYAEAALSGLSSTVADEIAIYAREQTRPPFTALDWASLGARKPATLSGGEQVLLALHCFSRSAYRTIGIDTALEQLDAQNRASALAYLGSAAQPFDVLLVDNRLADVAPPWMRRGAPPAAPPRAGGPAGGFGGAAARPAPGNRAPGAGFAAGARVR